MYLPPATVMPEVSSPPSASRSRPANWRRLPRTSKPPPVARAVTVEASCAVSARDSCEAEEPNSTCARISSCGRLGVEERVISGLAAVPLIRTVALSEGASQVAVRSSRICSGVSPSCTMPVSSNWNRLPAKS